MRIPSPPRIKTPSPPPPKAEPPKPPSPVVKNDELDKKRWGDRTRDSSWADEQERLRLAEERRKKAQEMYDKLRRRRQVEDGLDPDGPRFKDCKFTSQLNQVSYLY